MIEQRFLPGSHLVCRFMGESGDVIAGKVIKVQVGKVHIKNLLTNNTSIRKLAIVKKRSIIVPRSKAVAVRALFEKTGNKKSARVLAVSIATQAKKGNPPRVVEAVKKRKVGRPKKIR